MYDASYKSREKDYTDYYRQMVYSSGREMENVLGPMDENDFLIEFKKTTEDFVKRLKTIFDGLTIG